MKQIPTTGGLIGPIVFTSVVVGAAILRPGYSHVHQFISELGASQSPNAAIMNIGGFVIGGILIASLGLSLYQKQPRRAPLLFASVLVLLFGLGIILSGIFSCDLGCPQGEGSRSNLIHNNIAPVAFLCLILSSFIFGLQWRKMSELKSLSTYSIASGIAGILFLGLLASSLGSGSMTGLWQRLLLVVLFSWCMVVARRFR